MVMSYSSNQNTNKPPIAIIILILVVGIVLSCVGAVQSLNTKSKAEYYVSTSGVVVDYKSSQKSNNSAPVYEYKVNGKKYTYTENVYTASKQEIGKIVTIKYNPNNPQEAFADVSANSSFLFLGIGVFFTVIGLVLLLQTYEIFEKTITDLITGLLLSGVFIGFPIALLIAIPGLDILPTIILFALLIAGIIMLLGIFYMAFIKKDFSYKDRAEERAREISNNMNNKVDDLYNSDIGRSIIETQEKVTKFNNKYRPLIMFTMFAVFVILVVVNFPTLKEKSLERQKMKQPPKTEINDQMVAEYCRVSTNEVPKYIVYECVVVDRQDDTYFIEEVAGIPIAATSRRDFEIGDRIYWIEILGYDAVLLGMDKYTYSGTNLPKNSGRYDIDGKCIIDDEFLLDYCNGESTFTEEVTFTYNDGNEYFFEDSDNNEYSEIIPDELLRYYNDIDEGDVYYYVIVNNIGYLFNGDLYTCSR